MKTINRSAIAASALALALAPAALAHPGGGPGGNPPQAQHGQGSQHGQGHHKAKKVVAKGTVVSYDATTGTLTVHVTKANHHGAGMVGTDVQFDVSTARFVAADTNNDGKVDATDLVAGDKVVVKTTNVAGSDGRYAAKQVVDQTHPAASDTTDTTDQTPPQG